MNTNVKCIFAFAVGTAVGSAVAWKVLKTKYERLVQEEVDSVKEAFGVYRNETDRYYNEDDEPAADASDECHYLKGVKTAARKREYVDYNSMFNGTKKEEEATQDVEKPYAISPDEYGEFHDYECISLNHYSDGILADDDDEIVDDVDNSVGSDYVDHFGDHEKDVVHIRNDKLKCDYEICRDNRPYSEVTGRPVNHSATPHRVEG